MSFAVSRNEWGAQNSISDRMGCESVAGETWAREQEK